MDDCPHIPKDLLKWLNRVFPVKNPQPGTPLDEVFFDAGKRAVVEALISLHAQQEDDGLVP